MDRKMAKELIIPLPNGGSLRCGQGEDHVWGGYVSICDSSGTDLLYWDKAEFEEDAESVIGAIFVAALQPIDTLKNRTNKKTKTFLKNWKPISNAPTDGTVILTNRGTARYVDQRGWGSPVTNGWYLCTTDGDIPCCADDGMSISSISPEIWTDLPL
jgi:hypothetical protein